MPFLTRRTFLACSGATASVVLGSWGLAPHPTLARPAHEGRDRAAVVIGVDPAVMETGLTTRWSTELARDLGWRAQWVALPSQRVLAQLTAGELDAGVYLDHPDAEALARQGLLHSRVALARTPVYLVGPEADPADVRHASDLTQAIAQAWLAEQAGAARWAPPEVGSALEALVQRLAPARPPTPAAPRQIGGTGAPRPGAGRTDLPPYGLTTRAQWASNGARSAGLRIWHQGDPLALNLALPTRRRHPGAQLLLKWMQGPAGRKAWVNARPGWVPVVEAAP